MSKPIHPASTSPDRGRSAFGAMADDRSLHTGLDPRAAELQGDNVDPTPPDPTSQDGAPAASEPEVEPERPTAPLEVTPIEGDAQEELVHLLRLAEAHLSEMTASLAELQRTSARQAEHIDRLYTENERLRTAEAERLQDMVFRGVIEAYDSARSFLSSGETEGGEVLRLTHMCDQILAALDRVGVSRVATVPGEPFDGRVHHGAARVPCTDGEADYTIAHVLREGFERNGRVLRRTDVSVWRAQEPRPGRVAMTED